MIRPVPSWLGRPLVGLLLLLVLPMLLIVYGLVRLERAVRRAWR